MNKVLAIAGIAIRNAVRSRIVIILLGLLLLAIVGLPLTVKGDGTLTGQARILLGYTLGLVSFILSLATLWAGCAAVSLEIQDRQIQLIVAKPVRRAQIWLGKWLGLLILNAALIAFSGAVVYSLLRWTTRPEKLTAEQRAELRDNVLIACAVLKPEPVSVDDAARAELETIQARNPLPPDVPESKVLEAIKQKLLTQAYSVPRGGKRQWKFDAPAELPANHPLLFRFRFSSSSIGPAAAPGRWTVRRESDTAAFQVTQTNTPGSACLFKSPATAGAGGGKLIVEYENLSASPLIVVFDPEDGLKLFSYSGSFESNLARALLAILFRLAFFAALGVAAGSLFSMPVASFAAICVLLMIQIGGYIQSIAGQDIILHSPQGEAHGPTSWDHFFGIVFKAFSAVVGPLRDLDPLELLTTGQLMTWAWLGSIFLAQVVVYGGVLMLLSAWVLNKRELALPA
jgi:hypothetical protein